MEPFFFQPDFYERYYNCSAYNVEDIPLERRQHKWLGVGFIALTTVYQLLYIPCMISIWKHMPNSHCYKIMFYIGIIDMLTLVCNGWMTGYLGYVGAVFCSSPRLIYAFGAYGLGCWCAESSIEVVLALNRCIELWSSDLAAKMFGGKKLVLWLGIPTIYGIYYTLWTKPVIFTGIYFSWFFNPHVGYIDDPAENYENLAHTIHNNALLAILVISYAAFYIILMVKSFGQRQTMTGNDRRQHSFSQKMIFAQVFMISAINAIAASVYVYMQYFHISETIIIIGQFCWMNAHGIPPVIYVTMNKSIQRDIRAMFYRLVGKAVSIHPTSGTHAQHMAASRSRRIGGITAVTGDNGSQLASSQGEKQAVYSLAMDNNNNNYIY